MLTGVLELKHGWWLHSCPGSVQMPQLGLQHTLPSGHGTSPQKTTGGGDACCAVPAASTKSCSVASGPEAAASAPASAASSTVSGPSAPASPASISASGSIATVGAGAGWPGAG